MSQQSTPMEASGFGAEVLAYFAATTSAVVAAIQAPRLERAGRSVRSTIADRYSDEDLAGFGWSAEDIRRLKSK